MRAPATRDAAEITAAATARITEPIAGWRASGSLWPGQRFSLRVPSEWNARLVVAGCPGQRSEFACDRIFGDQFLVRGYAYVSGNKGNGDGVAVLEPEQKLEVDGVQLPRFPIGNGRSIAFFQHAPGHLIERWRTETIELAEMARELLRQRCGREPEVTYAAGLSNGGYQVRRAVETSDLFDGALMWNPLLWTPRHNVCRALSEAIRAAAENPSQGTPLERKHAVAYWYVTLWLHATHLDPETSIAYGDVRDPSPAESWIARIQDWNIERSAEIVRRIEGFANTGAIRCKTMEVASEFDYLTPPAIHCEPYRAMVEAAGKASSYRSRIVAGATHVDSWADDPNYPELRSGHAEMLAAWEELVHWVEGGPVKSR
ncbi:MAG TPA: hypothetical protein VFE36_06970 [Candidatus Baltobacteraceae bacterium]|nr:hypothetical protein [Candidatus Baltobacteraceae bacterium]